MTLTLSGPLFALAGCGGGGRLSGTGGSTLGGNSPSGSPFRNTIVAGKAELPIADVRMHGARVVSLFDDAALRADNSFQIGIAAGGPQLAFLHDAVGNIVLFGFLREGQTATLSIRSTAEALLYFALGLFAQAPSLQAQGLKLLKSAPIGPAEAAVRDAIARDGVRWLDGKHDALAGVFRTTAQALVGGFGGRGMFITPTERRSGILVEGDGIGTSRATNYFRRRARIYATPLSTQAQGGIETPLPQSLTPYEISPIAGVTSLFGSLADLHGGKSFYKEVTTDIPTPPSPADAAVTKYRLYAVGPGTQVGDLLTFPQAVKAGWFEVEVKAIIFDYVLPFFTNILLPLGTESVETFLNYLDSAAVVKDLTTAFAATEALYDKALAGSFVEACEDAVQLVWNSDTLKLSIVAAISAFAREHAPTGKVTTVLAETAFRKIGSILAAADFGFSAFDIIIQNYDLHQARLGETWEVTVTKPKVVIKPKESTIHKHGTVTLTASILDNDNSSDNLTYHWSVAGGHGHLVDTKGHSGAEFDSSADVVAYSHDAGLGADTVTVEVFAGTIHDKNRRSLGKGQATITIENQKKVVAGHFATETATSDGGLGNGYVNTVISGYVVIPRFQDSTSYDVQCSGFNDTAFYGTSINYLLSEPTGLPDKGNLKAPQYDVATPTDAYHFLAGYSGTGPPGDAAKGISDALNLLNARFGGMKVEVTVTF